MELTNIKNIQSLQKRHKRIRMPNDLNSFLQTINLSVWEKRIVLAILNLIKNEQVGFIETQEGVDQLQLFRTIWDKDNTTCTFFFHFTDFVPVGTKYKRQYIEQALKSLVTVGLSEQTEIKNGREIKRFTGMILDPIWEPKEHRCTLKMTSAWFQLFAIVDKGFNQWLYERSLLLSARASKFLHFLTEREKHQHAFMSAKQITDYFGVLPMSPSVLEKDILVPIKSELDSKGEISFNWKRNSNGAYSIAIYRTANPHADKVINIQNFGKSEDNELMKIKIAMKYMKKARNLNDAHVETFSKMCIKYSFSEIKGNINNKITDKELSYRGLKGDDFINKLLSKYPI